MRQRRMLEPALLIIAIGMLLLNLLADDAPGQDHRPGSVTRKPIALTAAPTEGGNFLLYRMWSDGLIDVRLVNPMRTVANDWPESNQAGISFQERWKILQYGD